MLKNDNNFCMNVHVKQMQYNKMMYLNNQKILFLLYECQMPREILLLFISTFFSKSTFEKKTAHLFTTANLLSNSQLNLSVSKENII